MTFRVIGNNTSFGFQSASDGQKITNEIWNSRVADNLENMKSVVDRIPAISTATITGLRDASATATPYGAAIASRHKSVVMNWTKIATVNDGGQEIGIIYPKSVITGSNTQTSTSSNYWVFVKPGIYHIELNLVYQVTVSPSMIRVAIVPYVNDGVNYHTNAPFDATQYTTNGSSLTSCLLAYTGKSDPNATGSYTVSLSGFVLVTSQDMTTNPGVYNIAKNSATPQSPGNGFHIEIEGSKTTSATERLTVTDGTLSISLLQEWWK